MPRSFLQRIKKILIPGHSAYFFMTDGRCDCRLNRFAGCGRQSEQVQNSLQQQRSRLIRGWANRSRPWGPARCRRVSAPQATREQYSGTLAPAVAAACYASPEKRPFVLCSDRHLSPLLRSQSPAAQLAVSVVTPSRNTAYPPAYSAGQICDGHGRAWVALASFAPTANEAWAKANYAERRMAQWRAGSAETAPLSGAAYRLRWQKTPKKPLTWGKSRLLRARHGSVKHPMHTICSL